MADGGMVDLSRRATARKASSHLGKGLAVLFDQGLCSITSFVAGVLVARSCPPNEYGVYVLGMGILIAVMGFQATLSGLPFTVLRLGFEEKNRPAYLGSTVLQHLLLAAIAAFALLLVAGWFLIKDGMNGSGLWLLALVPMVCFVPFRDFLRYVFLAQFREGTSLLMNLMANVAIVALLYWAYRGGWLSVPVAFAILGGCSALAVLVFGVREGCQVAFVSHELRCHVRENWRFAKWLVAKHGMFLVYAQIYPWALAFMGGAVATAVYGACMVPAMVLAPLVQGLGRFIIPRMAQAASMGLPHLRRVVFGAMLLLALPLLALALAAAFFSEDVLRLLFQAKYAGYGPVVTVLALQSAVNVVASPLEHGLTAMRETPSVFRATFVGACIALVVGMPLVVLWGPMGAGCGLLCSMATVRAYELRSFLSLSASLPAQAGPAERMPMPSGDSSAF